MYTEVSEACKEGVRGNVITTIARLTFDNFFSDSSDLVIEKDISSNGLKIADYCFDPQTGKLIGTAASKELEIEIINTENYDLANKEFNLEVGVLIDRTNLTYEYIPYGRYIVMSYEDLKSANKYKVIANDTMIKLNPLVRLNTAFTPTYPITAKEYYREFMTSYGIEIEEQELCNGDFLIENPLDFGENTGRYVLGRLAELFGSFAKMNRNNKCQMYLKTETDETIELSQMNSVLEIDKRYGPVNVVSVGLSQVEGENVTLEDKEGIVANGEITIRIDDNEFMYTEELREKAIEQLFERLKGFTYVPVSFKCKALLYSDCGDRINVRDIKTGNIVDTIILNQDIVIPKTRQSQIESPALTNNQQRYKYISQSKQAQTRTEIMVKKHEKEIKSIVEEIGDRSEKTTTITQDLESIELLAKQKADITNTIEGNGSIVLENTMAGELLELHIYGNNTVFDHLLPSDTLYPSDDLYPMGDSLIKVTRQTVNNDGEIESEESEIIDLEITEELRQKDDVRDEVSLVNNVLKLTRRIGVYADGTTYIKATPEITTIKDLKILTARGNLIIEILNYTAPLKSRYVTINDFTNTFTTTVEMQATIKLLYDQISLDVSHKVDNNEIFARMNMYIKGLGNQTDIPDDIPRSVIEFFANSFSWESDHSSMTADGILTLRNKATEPYMYTINDVMAVNNYIKGNTTLTPELLELYDATGDGVVNILDSVKMLNIIKGNIKSDKYADAEIIFNPTSPSEFITMKLAGVIQCKIGLNEIYNYTFRGMNMFLGVFADLENQYGISLNGEKGLVTIRSEDALTETRIDSGKVDAYYVLSSSRDKKGRCMHGIDETHDYLIHYTGTKLQFFVDDTNVGELSDERVKSDIIEVDDKLLSIIDELGFYQFKLANREGKISVGVIAQELLKLFEKYEMNPYDYDFIYNGQFKLTDDTIYYFVNYEQLLILQNIFMKRKLEKQEKKINYIIEKLGIAEEMEELLNGQ